MDQELRILHLDCTTGYGGQERDHISEAKGFLKKGHTYILGARTGTAFAREAGQAARTLELPLRNNLDLESLSFLRNFLRKEKIDVVVTTSYIDNWLGAMASFSLGKNRPLLIRQRHIMNPPKNLFPFRRLCDRLVVVSDALRIFFVESGLPFWHVVTIPRGSEFKSVYETGRNARTIREELNIPEGMPVLLQIGTFQKDKGHFLMLDSLKILWENNPDIVMIFLGTGPLFDEVVDRARNRFPEKFEKKLFFPGQRDPFPFFSIASAVVVPSIRESFSLVALESIGHGVPVVSFRVGGVPEIFNRTPGGTLVRPYNTRDFSKAVQDILFDKALQEKTKTEYSRKILGEFSLDRCVERTVSLYRWGMDRLRSGRIHQNPYRDVGGKADCFEGHGL